MSDDERPGLEQRLRLAVEDNDVELVSQLLREGADANTSFPVRRNIRYSILEIAIRRKYVPIVGILLTHGADPNIIMCQEKPRTDPAIFFALDYLSTTKKHKAEALRMVELLISSDRFNPNQALPENHYTPLHAAGAQNQPKVVKMLLDKPEININAFNLYGQTPLMVACSNRSHRIIDVVKLLLERPEIDISHVGPARETAVNLAIEHGHAEIALELLQRDDVVRGNTAEEKEDYRRAMQEHKFSSEDDDTLMKRAVKKNMPQVVEWLIRRFNFDANTIIDGRSLLEWACQHKYDELTTFLLSVPDIKVNEREGYTSPIYLVVEHGNIPLLRQFLSHPRFDVENMLKHTGVFVAAFEHMNFEIIRLLMGAAEPIKSFTLDKLIDELSTSQLFPQMWIYAIFTDNQLFAKKLKKHEINPNQLDESANSLWHVAAKHGLESVVPRLIEWREAKKFTVDINDVAHSSDEVFGTKILPTALALAVTNNHLTTAQLLVDAGAQVDIVLRNAVPLNEKQRKKIKKEETTMLMGELIHANREESLIAHPENDNDRQEIAKFAQRITFLVRNGADINQVSLVKKRVGKGDEMLSALMVATRSLTVTKVFLEAAKESKTPLRLDAQDANGATALLQASTDIARHDIIRLLIEAGADVNIPDRRSTSPLIALVIAVIGESPESGVETITKMIVQGKANVNYVGRHPGNEAINEVHGTALFFASTERLTELAQVLLVHGADPNIPSPDWGTTPLMEAVSTVDLELSRKLIKYGANVNAIDILTGTTVLEYALEPKPRNIYAARRSEDYAQDHLDIMHLLNENGVDVNYRDENGMTLLMKNVIALGQTLNDDEWDRKLTGLRLLLDTEKLDLTISNPRGYTAFELGKPVFYLYAKPLMTLGYFIPSKFREIVPPSLSLLTTPADSQFVALFDQLVEDVYTPDESSQASPIPEDIRLAEAQNFRHYREFYRQHMRFNLADLFDNVQAHPDDLPWPMFENKKPEMKNVFRHVYQLLRQKRDSLDPDDRGQAYTALTNLIEGYENCQTRQAQELNRTYEFLSQGYAASTTMPTIMDRLYAFINDFKTSAFTRMMNDISAAFSRENEGDNLDIHDYAGYRQIVRDMFGYADVMRGFRERLHAGDLGNTIKKFVNYFSPRLLVEALLTHIRQCTYAYVDGKYQCLSPEVFHNLTFDLLTHKGGLSTEEANVRWQAITKSAKTFYDDDFVPRDEYVNTINPREVVFVLKCLGFLRPEYDYQLDRQNRLLPKYNEEATEPRPRTMLVNNDVDKALERAQAIIEVIEIRFEEGRVPPEDVESMQALVHRIHEARQQLQRQERHVQVTDEILQEFTNMIEIVIRDEDLEDDVERYLAEHGDEHSDGEEGVDNDILEYIRVRGLVTIAVIDEKIVDAETEERYLPTINRLHLILHDMTLGERPHDEVLIEIQDIIRDLDILHEVNQREMEMRPEAGLDNVVVEEEEEREEDEEEREEEEEEGDEEGDEEDEE